MTAPPWTAGQLAQAAGGTLVAGDPATPLRGPVSTDTRLLAPGDAFLALPGEHEDGGRYVQAALRAGAVGALGARRHLAGVAPPAFAIAVADPHAALRAIARARRERLACLAVGVTGAVGKTTTTDLLAALLRRRLRTHATRHGFNTPQGVAATIALTPPDAEALVVEIGMKHPGTIAAGAALLTPSAAIVTRIAPEHLDTAGGTVAAVARNKAELIAALPPGAPCVVPAGEPLLAPYLREDLRTISHGPGGDVRLLACAGGVAAVDCAGERVELEVPDGPPHRLRNLVAAVALAWALELAPRERVRLDAPLSPFRWQRERLGDVELVLDCAKTSPLALCTALEEFAAEPAAARRIAVLAPLIDLGAQRARYHREAAEVASAAGIDVLVVVGEEEAPELLRHWEREAHVVATPAAARALLERIGRPGDRALVKGPSRAALQRIVEP